MSAIMPQCPCWISQPGISRHFGGKMRLAVFSSGGKLCAVCCRKAKALCFLPGDGLLAREASLHRLRLRQSRLARRRARSRTGIRPQGIHVAHVVIDGVIDGAYAREKFPISCAPKARMLDRSWRDRRCLSFTSPAAEKRLDS